MALRSLRVILVVLSLSPGLLRAEDKPADWSEQQIAKLPSGEKPIHLFNGKDLDGWVGQTGKYFNVQDGVIVAKNSKENAPTASTYLVTKQKFRNFRLIFESRLVESEMHSGIALWGQTVEKNGDPFSYQGHLVMYPSGYGYHDLYRRNSIYQDKTGAARRVGKQHDWNRMEIVASGRRIRHVINGRLVADWSDPQSELCQAGPIGLQLHSNSVPQEVQFRGLILTENPKDQLVTAETRDAGLLVEANPLESAADPAKLAKIDERMKEFVANKTISGAVTLVARRGRIVHHSAVGQADVRANRAMDKETLFAIASMTKPITATAVMILVDEGRLALADPVAKHLPAFRDVMLKSGGRPAREMTIRDLLTHTSGLGGDQRTKGSLAATVDEIATRGLDFEPGSKWQYGPSLSVCGRIVEVVSGQPFDEFLRVRIFEPLEMKSTSFLPSPTDQQARIARIYQPTADKADLEQGKNFLFEESTAIVPNPSGGLFSTALDMARFYQMILNGGELNGQRIVSADAVKQMTTIQTGELPTGFTPGNGWGLGWCVVRDPQGVTRMVSPGTFGHGGAFGTQGWVDPQKEAIYVLLIQRNNLPNADASELRDALQQLSVDAYLE
jgi:CubicO group peptidase (beta-lactamase class C family)